MESLLIAFDLNNTVFDLSSRPRGEIAAYAQHLELYRRHGKWLPWAYPEEWETLPAHQDAAEGIAALRAAGHRCVTMSNNPLPLQIAQSKHNGIEWDGMVPLEARRVYKTDPAAYMLACLLWRVPPSAVMMVTANKGFGDLEVAGALGMRPQLIRHPESRIATITDLANCLE